jgi:hypothetical protein
VEIDGGSKKGLEGVLGMQMEIFGEYYSDTISACIRIVRLQNNLITCDRLDHLCIIASLFSSNTTCSFAIHAAWERRDREPRRQKS